MRPRKLLSILAALAALAAAALAPSASAQKQINGCNCANATLIGTQANVHYANYPPATDWNGTVGTGIEMPAATNPLIWNTPKRFNVDLQASKIRVEFAQLATYGQPGSQFQFTLNPVAPPPCGAAKVVGSVITTNRADAAPYVIPGSSFGTPVNTVTVVFGNQGGTLPFLDWRSDDWIEAQLTFDCFGGTTQPGASTCCPPLTKNIMMPFFQETAHIVSQPYNVKFVSGPAYSTFVSGLQAYLQLLKIMCPQVANLKTTFSLYSTPALGGPLDGTGGSVLLQSVTVLGPLFTMPSGWFTSPLSQGQAYGIIAHTVAVNSSGNTVNCGFDAVACDMGDRFTFKWDVGNRNVAPGGAATTAAADTRALTFGN